MIPFALVSAQLHIGEAVREVRVTELGVEGFCIRLAEKIETADRIDLSVYSRAKGGCRHFLIENPKIRFVEEQPFCVILKVLSDSTEYLDAVNTFWAEYQAFLTSKTEDSDSVFSEKTVGYPAAEDGVFAETFAEQQREWGAEVMDACDAEAKDYQDFELAMALDQPKLYDLYLQRDCISVLRTIFEKNHLAGHPLTERKPDRLYIGNAFCHNLLPDIDKLFDLLNRARREKVAVSIVTTYLREEYIAQTEQWLDSLYEYCRRNDFSAELVVNDWGMLPLLQHRTDYVRPCIGVLLNKRRKDPRMKYHPEYGKQAIAGSSVDDQAFRTLLQERYKAERFEWEAGGRKLPKLTGIKNSLIIPYYQTNTSQYCTLYARYIYGQRGHQSPVRECSGLCSEYCFLYPKHLKMVGRYNSLFGFDGDVLMRKETVLKMKKDGVDRIVVQLPF